MSEAKEPTVTDDETIHIGTMQPMVKELRPHIEEHMGGKMIKGITLMQPGIWTDSNTRQRTAYTKELLNLYHKNWRHNWLWNVHRGPVPRQIDSRVGKVVNPRMENENIKVDLFFDMNTTKSKDAFAMAEASVKGLGDSISLSAEHLFKQQYDSKADAQQCTYMEFIGAALVEIGASDGTKLLSRALNPDITKEQGPEPQGDSKVRKEQEGKPMDEELKKEIAAMISAAMAEKMPPVKEAEEGEPGTPAVDTEAIKEEIKTEIVAEVKAEAVQAAKEVIAPIEAKVQEVEEKVSELSKLPGEIKTLSKAQEVGDKKPSAHFWTEGDITGGYR